MNAIPEYVDPEVCRPTIGRTPSEEMTRPMYMIDHTLSRQDGPPDYDPDFDDEEDTVVEECLAA